ncbi:hypothetical protein [Niallia taxi]|uniref:hypothetical protein n=1 Tax=Niallia taxi TaxID=2499688 RepID=UPI002E221A76|nr:hypothetical protein [Niallia taxi]
MMKFKFEILLFEKHKQHKGHQENKGKSMEVDKPLVDMAIEENSTDKGEDSMMMPPNGENPWDKKKDDDKKHDDKKHDDKKHDDKKHDDKKHDDKKHDDYAKYISITEQGLFAGIARNQGIYFTLQATVPFYGQPTYGTYQGLIKDNTGVYALILVGTDLYRINVRDFVTVV